MKRERIQFLVTVSIAYDKPGTGGVHTRADAIRDAREDLLMVNTLPSKALVARLVKKT